MWQTASAHRQTMNTLAEQYVKLVLALGQHDADYVDAYYGPAEWRSMAEQGKAPLAAIDMRATALLADLGRTKPRAAADELVVQWPDRQRESFSVPGLDRVLTVRQGEGRAP